MRLLFAVSLAAAAAAPLSAQTWKIVTDPKTAIIYRLPPENQGNALILVGTGTGEFKVKDKDPNTLIVHAEGYADERHTFLKGEKQPSDKVFTLILSRRIVTITALPYDATIYVNGEAHGQRTIALEVGQGLTSTVELRKPGFASIRRTYRFDRGGEVPPPTDRIELVDRVVNITGPSGAQILRDGVRIGEGNADLTIPRGGCSVARIETPGWLPAEKSYCNKEGLPDPPLTDRIAQSGRSVNVIAPPDAKVFVNQKQAGTGTVNVKVNDGTCVSVRVDQPAFVSETREYCAQTNAPAPPIDDAVTLLSDDSFPASISSDQANVNITIEVAKERTEESAWKLLSSIVLTHFDILENSDRETGYLRTAWQIKSYADGRVIVRTRIIVKRSSTDPLRYTIKIASERNRIPGITVKDDENFEPWQRLLATYKDVISEMQSRLQSSPQ
jgi:hypothetical protein